MADEIKLDTAVAIDLHPSNIDALAGGDEDIAQYLKPLRAWSESAYLSLSDLHSARRMGVADRSQTEASVTLKVAASAEKIQDKLTRGSDSLRKTLTTQIADIDRSLTTPLKQTAERGNIASEIRTHLKNLKPEERAKVLQEAHERGDAEVMGAALGGPALLIGITEEMRTVLTRRWNEKVQPEVSERLNVLTKARDKLDRLASLAVYQEVTKAIGAPWEKVNALRAANTDFEKALISNRFVTNPLEGQG